MLQFLLRDILCIYTENLMCSKSVRTVGMVVEILLFIKKKLGHGIPSLHSLKYGTHKTTSSPQPLNINPVRA